LYCTEEDQNKTEMYRQNLGKKQAIREAASFEEFLKSLQVFIKIWCIREDDICRASQLSQKTNQFNLTTRRYSEKDLRRIAQSSQYNVFIASVEDKFGDNGKTALAIVKIINDKLAELDTFLLSCRVMGKNVEERIVDYIENKLNASGIEELRTYYLPTAKNKPVAEFFDRLGYQVVNRDKSGSKQYTLILKEKPIRKSYARLAEI
jgi:FkbH-like protein